MNAMPFAAPIEFVGGVEAPEPAPTRALWFVSRDDRLLVESGPELREPSDDPRVGPRPLWARVPTVSAPATLGLKLLTTLYVGRLQQTHCFAAAADGDTAPAGFAWLDLRALFGLLDDASFALAGRALQLVDWDLTHRFCGSCATPTVRSENERARACPACGLVAYPRLAPAVMALVRRPPREILLARSHRFPTGMYSALAGFVEPGETIEQALAREVFEEVGVGLTKVRYFASQPWPFPHSLMIAFVADWAEGEIRTDPAEIADAEWFEIDKLPLLPSPISIARRLIDAVVAEMVAT
jgi:NAD+ diphosphatase